MQHRVLRTLLIPNQNNSIKKVLICPFKKSNRRHREMNSRMQRNRSEFGRCAEDWASLEPWELSNQVQSDLGGENCRKGIEALQTSPFETSVFFVKGCFPLNQPTSGCGSQAEVQKFQRGLQDMEQTYHSHRK